MEDISSDSEVFASDSGRYRGRSRKFIPGKASSSKVEKLASSLEVGKQLLLANINYCLKLINLQFT